MRAGCAVTVVLAGCYLSHGREDPGPREDAGPRADAGMRPRCVTTATERWAEPAVVMEGNGGWSVTAAGCELLAAGTRAEDREIVFARWSGSRWDSSPTGQRGFVSSDASAFDGETFYVAAVDKGVLQLVEGRVREPAPRWSSSPIEREGTWAAVETDARGRVHVAFRRADGPLVHRTRGPAGWTEEIVDARDSYDVTLAIDAEGAAHAAYLWVTSPSVHDVAYARQVGAAWETTDLEPRDPLDEIMGGPGIAAGGRTVHLAYGAFAGLGVRKVQHARIESGRWTFETVDDVASFGVAMDSIAVDADGHVHLVYRPTAETLRYASDRTGGFVAEDLPFVGTGGAVGIVVDGAKVVHVFGFAGGAVVHTYRR